jgi:hypothetical protein
MFAHVPLRRCTGFVLGRIMCVGKKKGREGRKEGTSPMPNGDGRQNLQSRPGLPDSNIQDLPHSFAGAIACETNSLQHCKIIRKILKCGNPGSSCPCPASRPAAVCSVAQKGGWSIKQTGGCPTAVGRRSRSIFRDVSTYVCFESYFTVYGFVSRLFATRKCTQL